MTTPHRVSAILTDCTGEYFAIFAKRLRLGEFVRVDELEKIMNLATGVPVPCLSPGLPTVVMGDGTRCLLDNNTLWIPAGNPVDLTLAPGYPQPTLLQPRVQPSMHGITLPTTVQPTARSVFQPAVPQPPSPGISGTSGSSLPSSQLDLQLIRPEDFSCVLPPLDLPRPLPQSMSVSKASQPKATSKTPILSKRKPELKPCKRKPRTFRPKPEPKPRIPKEKVRKNQPESKPYFVPQPLGAKHIKPQSRTLGDRITKPLGDHGIIKPSTKLSFAGQLKSADRAYLKPKSVLPSTGCKTLPVPVKKVKDKVVSESESAKSGNVTVADESVNPDKAVDRDEPNSDDEYDVEYLYLTKLILRKKRKPTAEPSTEPLPSRKRKCPDDNSQVPQAMKQARLEEPQDSLEDLEALLAEYSTSLSSGTRDFF
ncbi:nucleolar protein dao-5-like [Haliotis rubra]|uniref:nucleolar protein dao-5-like n=1 Tax=Haliotis rubra TaxID=36100 RepID=UPI001EE596F8|nr:nucleolar protein dao-5-like [Haliotis rubra]